jgi:hypothetical protein
MEKRIEKIDGEDCVSFFNNELHYEIFKIRSKEDSPYFFDYKKWAHLVNHPLTNRKIHDNKTNKDYTIEGVYQEFYKGYFIKLLVRTDEDSHGVRYWENISCIEPSITNAILENKEQIVFID